MTQILHPLKGGRGSRDRIQQGKDLKEELTQRGLTNKVQVIGDDLLVSGLTDMEAVEIKFGQLSDISIRD